MGKDVISTARTITSLATQGISVTSSTASALVDYLNDMENMNYDIIPERKSIGRLGYIEGEGFSPFVDGLVFDGDTSFKHLYESIRSKYKVKGNKIKTIGAIRKGTGLSKDEAMLIADELFIDEMPPMRTYERDQKKKAEMDAAGQVYCPKCLSTSISTNQKGFGFGRGAIGAAIGLDVGLIAGGIGSKKIICTCLKCGYQWKPGTK